MTVSSEFIKTQYLLQEITLSEFFLIKGIKKIYIYINQEDLEHFTSIYYSIAIDHRVQIILVSDNPFKAPGIGWHIASHIKAIKLNPSNLSKRDKLVTFSFMQEDTKAELEKAGVQIYRHNAFNKELFDWVFYTRPLAYFAYTHPKVAVISFNRSLTIQKMFRKDKELLSASEKKLLEEQPDPELIFAGLGFTDEDIRDISTYPASYIGMDGVKRFSDKQSRCHNIIDGHRYTVDQPKEYERTIWCIGNCLVYGVYCSDKATAASTLQKQLNQIGKKVRVENYGMFALNDGESPFHILNALPVKDNDIVLFSVNDLGIKNRYFVNLNISSLFMRPHDFGEVYYDIRHYNDNGAVAVGECIYQHLLKHDFYENVDYTEKFNQLPVPYQPSHSVFGLPFTAGARQKTGLDVFKENIKKVRIKIGSIVMNCNPFTLGHRYLIEYASSQVEHLYVFVVEEDKSFFPFQDRFLLVQKGTADLKNVTVLPSGNFMISSITFSDYFNKSEIQDKVIDPSNDLIIFSKEIAPVLGITVRFAGEEPLDMITQQYNDAMHRILPQNGIEFIVIPRKEKGGAVISASRVRRLLEKKAFDQIAEIVPAVTFEYLVSKYGVKEEHAALS